MGINSLLTSIALLFGLILFVYFGVYKNDVDEAKIYVNEINLSNTSKVPNVLKIEDSNESKTDSTYTIKEDNKSHERVIMMLTGVTND